MSAQWPRPPLGWAGAQSRAWARYRAEVRAAALGPCEYELWARLFPGRVKCPCPDGAECRTCEARALIKIGEV